MAGLLVDPLFSSTASGVLADTYDPSSFERASGVNALSALAPTSEQLVQYGQSLAAQPPMLSDFGKPQQPTQRPPDIAVNRATGDLYVQGHVFTQDDYDTALRVEPLLDKPGVGLPSVGDWEPLSRDTYAQFLHGVRNPGVGRQLSKGFGRGVDQLQQIGGGLLAALGAEELGKSIYRDNEEDLRKSSPYARNFTDIKSAGDAGSWLVANFAEQGPMLLETIATAIAGFAAGSAVGTPIVGGPMGALAALFLKAETKKVLKNALAKKVAGEAVSKAEEEVIKKAGQIAVSTATAMSNMYGIGVGDIYGEMIDQGVDGDTAARLKAFAGAVPYAALDALPLGMVASKFFNPVVATAAKDAGFWKRFGSGLARRSKSALEVGLSEGTGETFQEALNIGLSGQDLSSPEAINRYINSFAAGFGMGAPLGFAGSRAHTANDPSKQTNLLQNAPAGTQLPLFAHPPQPPGPPPSGPRGTQMEMPLETAEEEAANMARGASARQAAANAVHPGQIDLFNPLYESTEQPSKPAPRPPPQQLDMFYPEPTPEPADPRQLSLDLQQRTYPLPPLPGEAQSSRTGDAHTQLGLPLETAEEEAANMSIGVQERAAAANAAHPGQIDLFSSERGDTAPDNVKDRLAYLWRAGDAVRLGRPMFPPYDTTRDSRQMLLPMWGTQEAQWPEPARPPQSQIGQELLWARARQDQTNRATQAAAQRDIDYNRAQGLVQAEQAERDARDARAAENALPNEGRVGHGERQPQQLSLFGRQPRVSRGEALRRGGNAYALEALTDPLTEPLKTPKERRQGAANQLTLFRSRDGKPTQAATVHERKQRVMDATKQVAARLREGQRHAQNALAHAKNNRVAEAVTAYGAARQRMDEAVKLLRAANDEFDNMPGNNPLSAKRMSDAINKQVRALNKLNERLINEVTPAINRAMAAAQPKAQPKAQPNDNLKKGVATTEPETKPADSGTPASTADEQLPPPLQPADGGKAETLRRKGTRNADTKSGADSVSRSKRSGSSAEAAGGNTEPEQPAGKSEVDENKAPPVRKQEAGKQSKAVSLAPPEVPTLDELTPRDLADIQFRGVELNVAEASKLALGKSEAGGEALNEVNPNISERAVRMLVARHGALSIADLDVLQDERAKAAREAYLDTEPKTVAVAMVRLIQSVMSGEITRENLSGDLKTDPRILGEFNIEDVPLKAVLASLFGKLTARQRATQVTSDSTIADYFRYGVADDWQPNIATSRNGLYVEVLTNEQVAERQRADAARQAAAASRTTANKAAAKRLAEANEKIFAKQAKDIAEKAAAARAEQQAALQAEGEASRQGQTEGKTNVLQDQPAKYKKQIEAAQNLMAVLRTLVTSRELSPQEGRALVEEGRPFLVLPAASMATTQFIAQVEHAYKALETAGVPVKFADGNTVLLTDFRGIDGSSTTSLRSYFTLDGKLNYDTVPYSDNGVPVVRLLFKTRLSEAESKAHAEQVADNAAVEGLVEADRQRSELRDARDAERAARGLPPIKRRRAKTVYGPVSTLEDIDANDGSFVDGDGIASNADDIVTPDGVLSAPSTEEFLGMDDGVSPEAAADQGASGRAGNEKLKKGKKATSKKSADSKATGKKAAGRYSAHTGKQITTPLSVGRILLAVKAFLGKLYHKPKVTVVKSLDDLKANHKELYERAKAARAEGDFDTRSISGVAYSFGDDVIVFSDRIFSTDQLHFVMAHETLGHFGLRSILSDNELNRILDDIYTTDSALREAVDVMVEAQGMSRREATEEVLSDRAASIDVSILARVWAAIKNALNKLGVKFSDDMARYYIYQARRYVRNGTPANVFSTKQFATDFVALSYEAATGRFSTATGATKVRNPLLSKLADTAFAIGGANRRYSKDGSIGMVDAVDAFQNGVFGKAGDIKRLVGRAFEMVQTLNNKARRSFGLSKINGMMTDQNNFSNTLLAKYQQMTGLTHKAKWVGGEGVTEQEKEVAGELLARAALYKSGLFLGQQASLGPSLVTILPDGSITENPTEFSRLFEAGFVTAEEFRKGIEIESPDGTKVTFKYDVDENSNIWKIYKENREAIARAAIDLLTSQVVAAHNSETQLLKSSNLSKFGLKKLDDGYHKAMSAIYGMYGTMMNANLQASADGFSRSRAAIAKADAMVRAFGMALFQSEMRDALSGKIKELKDIKNPHVAQLVRALFETEAEAKAREGKNSYADASMLSKKDLQDLIPHVEAVRKTLADNNMSDKMLKTVSFRIQDNIRQGFTFSSMAESAEHSAKRTILTSYVPFDRRGNHEATMQAVDVDGNVVTLDAGFASTVPLFRSETRSGAEELAEKMASVFGDNTYTVLDATGAEIEVTFRPVVRSAKATADLAGTMNLADFIYGLTRLNINITPVERERMVEAFTSQGDAAQHALRRAGREGWDKNVIRSVSQHLETTAHVAAKIMYQHNIDAVVATERFWRGDRELLNRLSDAVKNAKTGQEKYLAQREYDEYAYMYYHMADSVKDNEFMYNGKMTMPLGRGRIYQEEAKSLVRWYRSSSSLQDDATDALTQHGPRLKLFAVMMQLGLSVATGLVNLTSMLTHTPGYLAFYNPATAMGGGHGLGKSYASVWQSISDLGSYKLSDAGYLRKLQDDKQWGKYGLTEDELDFLVKQSESGTTQAAQYNAMVGSARGAVYSNRAQAAVRWWMSPFSYTEQLNRRATALAAYRLERARLEASGITDPKVLRNRAVQAAERAVGFTQGQYAMFARPSLARNSVLQYVFMYKVFPILTVELLRNLPTSGRIHMLAMLFLFSGLRGMPGAEDMMDLINTIAQKLGLKMGSIEKHLTKAIEEVAPGMSPYAMRGVIDHLLGGTVSSRIGAGDLFPMSGIGKASANPYREAVDFAGPVVSGTVGLTASATDTLKYLAGKAGLRDDTGSLLKIAREAPAAGIRSAADAISYAIDGKITNSRGVLVSPEVGMQAIITRALGFYPVEAKEQTDLIRMSKDESQYLKSIKTEFALAAAKARVSGDSDRYNSIMRAVQSWNASTDDPSMKITKFNQAVSESARGMQHPQLKQFRKTLTTGQRKELDTMSAIYGFEP